MHMEGEKTKALVLPRRAGGGTRATMFVTSILAVHAQAQSARDDSCDSASPEDPRRGVFFATDAFPGTPGQFANRQSSPPALEEIVARWRTPYDAAAGPLTAEQHAQFFDEGFLILPSLLPADVVAAAIDSVEGLVDGLARKLHSAGAISSTHADADFHTRLARVEREYPHASVLLHKGGVLPEGIQRVWGHNLLMGIAQQLLGSDVDIAGHPVWNLRCKTPEVLSAGQATVPWHQDNAYLDEESWDVLQLTAWIPLVDTNATNGCMQVVRGGHRRGGTATHACCVGNTWYIETTPEELESTLMVDMRTDVVTCAVPRGGVLLLNNLIPHRSLPNQSPGIRWSLDLRWQRADQPNGFDGLKASVLMKKAGEPYSGSVAWGNWAQQDRTQLQAAAHAKASAEQAEKVDGPTFDTTIAGPWMKKWPLVHSNRHTATLA